MSSMFIGGYPLPLGKARRSGVGLLSTLLMVLLTFSVFGLSAGHAAEGDEAVLEAVDISNLPGNRVLLRFRLSQSVEKPQNFTINDPARIVLDFFNTRNGMSARQQDIGSGVAEKITVLEGNDRTRASISLARLVPYTIRTQGNMVLLTLESAGTVTTVSPAPPVASIERAPSLTSAAPTLGSHSLTNIDFRRSPQGAGVIGIKLSDPSITVDVRQEGNQIVADFLNVTLPRGQERRLDVTDFATPVTLIDAMNRGNSARITVQPTGRYEYLAYQTDDLYTIEVRPLQREEEETRDPTKKKFTGELLSLNFQDIEVRAVLQIIADFTGLNVVVSDTVQGNLTLRLQNVPWDQALDIILTTKGLTQRRNGNVIYIAPTEEVTARERLELEAQQQVTELIPLQSELMQVNYAKASDLAVLLKQAGSDEAGGSTLLSSRGQVTVDMRTNTLLVQDVPEKLVEVRSLITRLDVPVRQVMIDSRLVVANDDFSRELGFRYGFSGVKENGDSGIISVTGSAQGNDGVVNSAINNLQNTGQAFPVAVPSLVDRLGVDLPVSAPTGRLALALLGQDYLIDLELSALQAEGRGEVLSNPRVITTDRHQATILQGREIPFQERSEGGEVTVSFKEALLELEVTPQITPDDRIIMDLTVKRDDVGELVQTGTGGVEPSIDRREVDTQVLVNNGETVVLGGVFEHTTRNDVDKVPLLGDIPGLGRLFQRRLSQNSKAELLIFVTPQIVNREITSR